MRKLCLFDLDGTLTNPKIGITKSADYALKSFGIHTADLDSLKKFIGPPLQDSFREFYNFSETQTKEAIRKYREYFAETGIFENVLYKGILEMLGRLSNAGITMVIATSKPTVYAERIADRFGFREFFETVAGSELDGNRSKKRDVITYALNLLDPGRKTPSAMIGDRKHDIIGARETCIAGIGVTWGYGTRTELENAGAVRIAESPEELFRLILGDI